MKIVSWNVNGIRAILQKNFREYVEKESPDILCLQEIKAHPDQLDMDVVQFKGYHCFWNPGARAGYSGVATFTKIKPLHTANGFGIPEYDTEGRVIMTEFKEFTLFNIYFPNGQKDDERLKFKMNFYEDFLKEADLLRRKGMRLIICGDYNTAHKEIDLSHPKANEKFSGFLPIERAWLDKLVSHGYVDTFRHFHSEPKQYSWWSYRMKAREKNIGWRLDYHFISEDLLPCLKKAYIQQEIKGSDHCPVVIEID